jgi:Na+/alanine symporter
MDYKKIADLLFPDLKLTVEDIEKRYPKRNLRDDQVVSRYAPSPTGFMHIGNFLQMNSLSDILHEICQTPKIVCGITVSVLLLFLLRKNFKFVSSVTSLLIPLASFLYILMCICVIIDCIEYVPYAFVRIFDDAFQIKAGIGGRENI